LTKVDDSVRTVKKILIIEDHILFRDGLISLFESTDEFDVVGDAETVFEGVEKARSLKPDIILMDFSLPDGTGLDATKIILSEMPKCKIVFLTVYEADEKLFSAIRAGAKGFLPKNVARSDLISSLHALDRDEIAISRKMASHIVDEFSHSNLQSSSHDELLSRLTPREMDVLGELQGGLSNQEISKQLFISENTVKHHIRNILNKLEVENRREAGLIARQAGLKSKGSET
jgi:DNA-binding NarL/FixJ family response regulator